MSQDEEFKALRCDANPLLAYPSLAAVTLCQCAQFDRRPDCSWLMTAGCTAAS